MTLKSDIKSVLVVENKVQFEKNQNFLQAGNFCLAQVKQLCLNEMHITLNFIADEKRNTLIISIFNISFQLHSYCDDAIKKIYIATVVIIKETISDLEVP